MSRAVLARIASTALAFTLMQSAGHTDPYDPNVHPIRRGIRWRGLDLRWT
jgi:hypothetical protein